MYNHSKYSSINKREIVEKVLSIKYKINLYLFFNIKALIQNFIFISFNRSILLLNLSM